MQESLGMVSSRFVAISLRKFVAHLFLAPWYVREIRFQSMEKCLWLMVHARGLVEGRRLGLENVSSSSMRLSQAGEGFAAGITGSGASVRVMVGRVECGVRCRNLMRGRERSE